MVDEPGDTTPSEEIELPGDSGARQSQAPQTIAHAAALWRRHGYRVEYQDAYLAQLVRRGGPDPLALALGLAIVGAVAVWWYMSRAWLVISITAAPDGRLVVHRQRSRRPPPR